MELRVARAWQVRPSELLTWTRRDLVAAGALLQYEKSIGPCGHSHVVTGGDGEGWWEVRDDESCWACAALQEYRKAHEKAEPIPGQQIRVVDTRTEPSVKE